MIPATYKNLDGQVITLALVESRARYFLELAPTVWLPFTQSINPVFCGLELLMADIYTAEALAEHIREKLPCLGFADLDAFLDRPGLRKICDDDFKNATRSRLEYFNRELNQLIAARSGTTFTFHDIDVDLDFQEILSSEPLI